MKAVLISIKPEWCELIAIGRKKLELRKSFPTLPIPFKCYIYQTKRNWVYRWVKRLGLFKLEEALPQGQGKVIGEFICFAKLRNCEMANADLAEKASCVRREDILNYANGKEVLGWGICDLKIYDIPKPLSKFVLANTQHYCHLQRPPQSWCYVEELKDA